MHTIRLRRPWQRTIAGGEKSEIVDVPDFTKPGTAEHQALSVCYCRAFNRPTGLDDDSRVYLRIESWTGSLKSVLLNDHPLEIGSPPLQIDITSHVQPHNQVQICIDKSNEAARLGGEVELLIE